MWCAMSVCLDVLSSTEPGGHWTVPPAPSKSHTLTPHNTGCILGMIPKLWQLLHQLKGPSNISWDREAPGYCLVYLHRNNWTHSTLLRKCSMLRLLRWWCGACRHSALSSPTVLAHFSASSQTHLGLGQTKAGFQPPSHQDAASHHTLGACTLHLSQQA